MNLFGISLCAKLKVEIIFLKLASPFILLLFLPSTELATKSFLVDLSSARFKDSPLLCLLFKLCVQSFKLSPQSSLLYLKFCSLDCRSESCSASISDVWLLSSAFELWSYFITLNSFSNSCLSAAHSFSSLSNENSKLPASAKLTSMESNSPFKTITQQMAW